MAKDFRKKPSKAIKGTFGVLSGITQPSCLYHSQFYWISLFTVLMIKFEKLPKQIQSYKATLKILPLYILTAQGFLFNFEFVCNQIAFLYGRVLNVVQIYYFQLSILKSGLIF